MACSRAARRLLTVLGQDARASALRGPAQQARSFADDANLKKTALYDFHVAHGGKMVPFAGWSMPIQYKDSIMESTQHCRKGAALFDVAHMCGLSIKGKDAVKFIEQLVVGDIAGLAPGSGTLSVLTNERGGSIDDTVVTKVTDTHLYMVVNAGCREKDLAHMGAHLKAFQAKGGDASWHIHDERGLLALQGPKAASALQALTKADLSKMYFGNFAIFDVAGVSCFVTRTGYTGEDGFEISIPHDGMETIADKLVKSDGVKLSGLGARDSLRLEAGLCLYGNDLTEDISPIEAGLAWTVGKRRREAFDFLGGSVIKQQLATGVSRKRVGFITQGAPARGHSKIVADGKEVGEITSGGFSPCMQKNIAIGYISSALAKVGTEVKVEVRGKQNAAVVSKMPFVPARYYKQA